MEEHEVVRSLAALAQESRLRVFRTLVVAGPLGLTPGALSEELGVAATTLSFHLKELTNAGLVSPQRDGRYLIYRAAYDRMNGLLAYLTAHCCQGEDCLVTAQPGASACC
jgi:DNA-binding transcriptional ArsR family regulator